MKAFYIEMSNSQIGKQAEEVILRHLNILFSMIMANRTKLVLLMVLSQDHHKVHPNKE